MKKTMRVIKDHTDYIERRLAGEEVVPRAYVYGLTAVEKRQSGNEMMVISISHDDLSSYIYEVKGGNFRISSFQENVHHSLSEVLTDGLLDNQTQAWWKQVFYERDGQCIFDHAYDILHIAENSNQTFQEMIESVAICFNGVNPPSMHPSTVCVVGEYSTNPLVRYVLQQKLNSINLIPCEDTSETYQGSQNQIILPTKKIEVSPFKINGGLTADQFMNQPITVTFPLCCLDNDLVNDIKWSQLISDHSPDYNVGSLDFKCIFLQVECDVFGTVFLSCTDMHGNRSIVKL